MAITVDAISSSDAGAGTSLTFSHTCAAGAVLYVSFTSISGVNNNDIDGITYNTVALTKAVDKQGTNLENWSGIWYLDNPASGAHNIVISRTGNSFLTGAGVSLLGARTGGSLSATQSANTVSAASLALSITTNFPNSLIIDSLFQNGNGVQTNTATGTGHTRQVFHYNPDGEAVASGTTTTTTAGSYTLGYNSSPNEIMILCAAEVRPILSSFTVSDTVITSDSVTTGRKSFISVLETIVTSDAASVKKGWTNLVKHVATWINNLKS